MRRLIKNAGLATYTEALGPVRDATRIDSEMQQLLHDQRRARIAHGVANLNVVKALVGALPTPAYNMGNGEYTYRTRSVDAAKGVLAYTRWWRGTIPYCLIGVRPGEDRKWTDILLQGAGPNGNTIIATIKKDSHRVAMDQEVRNLTTDLDENLFNENTGDIVIAHSTSGAIGVKGIKWTLKGINDGVAPSISLDNGISPELMDAFDVEKRLNTIAVSLDSVPLLDQAYSVRDRQIPS